MLPALYRRVFLKKLLTLSLALILCWFLLHFELPALPRWQKTPERVHLHRPRFQLEQNGDYWIYNDFIRSTSSGMKSNTSITLTTYGTWRDLKYMGWLLVRWSAPISMTLYVHENEFEQTLQQIYYIRYCTAYATAWTQWVSVQLVFSDKHFPKALHSFSWEYPHRSLRCGPEKQMISDSLAFDAQNIYYPVNLLRNVARLNAKTFYVLTLEPKMLPTKHFVKKFFEVLDGYEIRKPLRSIYCIPVFPQVSRDSQVPIDKRALLEQLQPYLNGSQSLSSIENERLIKMRPWLRHRTKWDGDIEIYSVLKQPTYCSVYVSSNAYEPLYDQRYEDYSYDTNSTRLQVLVGLGFDFVVLDGTFIIYRQLYADSEIPREVLYSPSSPQKLSHIRELIEMNEMAPVY
ncbi:hypothetical protein KR222_009331 [Zaprionus bogoriensis]|nr:hypothetical protein KR222_009331 [Zaprionus bogoriensis]